MRPSDEHEGWVSVWLGATPVPAGPPVDTLRDLCGVDHHRLSDQESHGSPSPVPVAALFEDVSFIGSFLPEVLAAAQRMDIVRACRMTVQFDLL